MARAATNSKPRVGKPQIKFVHKLVLNQWLLSLFDVKRFEQLAEHLRNEKLEGMDENIRRNLEQAGRDPRGAYVLNQQTVIVGETDAEALRKLEEYRGFASRDGALTLMSGWTGIDLSKYAPDQLLKHIETNAMQSVVEAFSAADPDRQWTIREIAEYCAIGGDGPVIVGSAAKVSDALQEWVEETDVDGFNLSYVVTPETFIDIADLLVPELQRRGAFKQDYADGTLREKLFGKGPRLGATHPASRYRHLAPSAAQQAAG